MGAAGGGGGVGGGAAGGGKKGVWGDILSNCFCPF